jgi:hypothetical protein
LASARHAARPAEAKRGEHRHPRPAEAQPKRSHAPHPPRPAKPAQGVAHGARHNDRGPRRDEDGNVRSNLPPALQAAFRRTR